MKLKTAFYFFVWLGVVFVWWDLVPGSNFQATNESGSKIKSIQNAPVPKNVNPPRQIHTPQMIDQISVEPRAGVTIKYDSNGKLIQRSGENIENLSIANKRLQSSQEIKNILKDEAMGKLEGGRAVLWLRGGQAYHAYEYFRSGRRIIANAEDGSIMLNKDVRKH